MQFTNSNISLSSFSNKLAIILQQLEDFNSQVKIKDQFIEEYNELKGKYVELKITEYKNWSQMIKKKVQQLQNQDLELLIEFQNKIGKGTSGQQLFWIENLLQSSNLMNCVQRIALVDLFLELNMVQDKQLINLFRNLINYYSLYRETLGEVTQEHTQAYMKQIENQQKIVNWQFDSIANLKRNMQIFYQIINRNFNRLVKELDLNFYQSIVRKFRENYVCLKYEGQSQFLQKYINLKNDYVNPSVIKQNKFLQLIKNINQFSQYNKNESLFFLSILSPRQILKIFRQKSKQFKYKFKLNFPYDQLKECLFQLQTNVKDFFINEQLRKFQENILKSLVNQLKNEGIYQRTNQQNLSMYFNLYQGFSNISLKEWLFEFFDEEQKKGLLNKIQIINKSINIQIDMIRNLKENTNYSKIIDIIQQQEIIDSIYSMFVKNKEFIRQIKLLLEKAEKIIERLKEREKQRKMMNQRINYLIEVNSDVYGIKENDFEFYQQLLIVNQELEKNKEINYEQLIQKIIVSENDNMKNFKKQIIEIINKEFQTFDETEQKRKQKDLNLFEKEYKQKRQLFKQQLKKIIQNENIIQTQAELISLINIYLITLHKILKKHNIDSEISEVLQIDIQSKILHSINFLYKFAQFNITNSLFLSNLLYQGFKEKQGIQEEGQKLQGDDERELGTGIGEGQGIQNVSNEIEFEEQVMGAMNETNEENCKESGNNKINSEDQEEGFDIENDMEFEQEKQLEKNKGEEEEIEDNNMEEVENPEEDMEMFQQEQETEENQKQLDQLDAKQLETEKDQNENSKLNQKEKQKQNKDKRNIEEQKQFQEQEEKENEFIEENNQEEKWEDNENKFEKEENQQQQQNDQNDSLECSNNYEEISSMETNKNDLNSKEMENQNKENESGDQNQMQEKETEHEQNNQQIEPEKQSNDNLISKQNNVDKFNQDGKQDYESYQKSQEINNKQEMSYFQGTGKTKNKNSQTQVNQALEKLQENQIDQIFDQEINQSVLINQQKVEEQQKINETYQDRINQIQLRQIQIQTNQKDESNQIQQNQQSQNQQETYQDNLQKREIDETLIQNDIQNKIKKIKQDYSNNQIEANPISEILELYRGLQLSSNEQQISQLDLISPQESLHYLTNQIQQLSEDLKQAIQQVNQSDLKGDYRTGKRLNIKRFVSYIASNYKKDKIWLRRTDPQQTNYRIMISIDDSYSMKDNNFGKLALMSMYIIQQALQQAQLGDTYISKIRQGMEIIEGTISNISTQSIRNLFSRFQFDYQDQFSSDLSIPNFINQSKQFFEKFCDDKKNICFIISDGRLNKSITKKSLQEAENKNILYIMIILDKSNERESLQNYQTVSQELVNGKQILQVKMYLEDFPFKYYCLIRDISKLPHALIGTLKDYFQNFA